MKTVLLALGFVTGIAGSAHARSAPECLVVVGVASGDALNMRSGPSAQSGVVDELVPGQLGIIHLDEACRPRSAQWGNRWCPVTHYNGDAVTKGWVKARYVRDSECL